MTTLSSNDVTGLLQEWRKGDRAAFERLLPLVYEEIRRIAHRFIRKERDRNTLQTTALINEAYIRLVGQQNVDWEDRSHFFAVTAQVMRHVLIDHARRISFAKRGGGAQHVSLDNAKAMTTERAAELIALDEALIDLAKLDSRKSLVVELRYFGGLSLEETADVMEISVMTVRRDWRAAKAWLYRRLNDES